MDLMGCGEHKEHHGTATAPGSHLRCEKMRSLTRSILTESGVDNKEMLKFFLLLGSEFPAIKLFHEAATPRLCELIEIRKWG